MCEEGNCRPCRMEDRLLDIAMGSTRVYTESTLPPLETRIRQGPMIQLNLLTSVPSRINKPRAHSEHSQKLHVL
ncbi:hypothetical protein HWD32_gp51 [Gordonia phage Secretariat]|uniref:Uncharacterized protein n=1 Tax=Gordonia phage Secretariat TaxID=2725616 RepID=A0A6M3SWW8_9CAUD|nr:hypothetical protein HWD32_gp51 [Gordonia phage Secretariat]QJD49628.1 hypothetical protein SEA_SECRETARIAT_51 [Gordonia phage Secretariat]